MLQIFLCISIERILLLQTLVNGQENVICLVLRFVVIPGVLRVFLAQTVIRAGADQREYGKGYHAEQDKDQQD